MASAKVTVFTADGSKAPTRSRGTLRALHVIPGLPDGSLMIFARRESASLKYACIADNLRDQAIEGSPVVAQRSRHGHAGLCGSEIILSAAKRCGPSDLEMVIDRQGRAVQCRDSS